MVFRDTSGNSACIPMSNHIDENLHPFITEYVEKTMDGKVKEVFEELLHSDLRLKRYVAQVASGRGLLRKFAPAIQKQLIKSTVVS
jgi:hypothetical protein